MENNSTLTPGTFLGYTRLGYRIVKFTCYTRIHYVCFCGREFSRTIDHMLSLRAKYQNFKDEMCHACLRKKCVIGTKWTQDRKEERSRTMKAKGLRFKYSKEICEANGRRKKQYYIDNPDARKKHSDRMKQLHLEGRFANARFGCKWYEHTCWRNLHWKLQGTWEVAYANWLDENHISYEAHKGFFHYYDIQGKVHTYYPDFYLIDSNEFIDTKCNYFYNKGPEKFDYIRRDNPEIKLTILLGDDLRALGVKIPNGQR